VGFKDEFKAGWKGQAGTPPAPSLLEALARNEGFKQRSSLKSVLGLATSALNDEEPILWACIGTKKEGNVTFFTVLAILQNRVILAQHSYLESFPKFSVSEIPLDKISNVRVSKGSILNSEIVIETSGANLSMSGNPKWLESAKTALTERIGTKRPLSDDDVSGSSNVSTDLIQLAQLLKDGIITQEEFQIAKSKLLGSAAGNEATKEEPATSSKDQSIFSQDDFDSITKDDVSKSEMDASGNFFTKKKIALGLSALLLLVAIPVNNSFQESKRISAQTKTAELEAQTINDAFAAELLRVNFPDCKSIQDVISSSVYPEFDALTVKTKKISDAREALSFVSSNSVVATGLGAKYLSDLESKLLIGLKSVYSNSERDELASETQLTSWKSQWKEAVLTNCNLLAENTSAETYLQKLDSEFKRITILAGSVPWYPEGFSEFDANTAYKYNKGGCDYFDCHNVSIVTKTGCSQIYAEMTLMDSSGANVGYTNDTSTAVQPLQVVKMRFDVIEESADTGRLTEVSCY
jgi:hypothetical protein